MAVANFAGFLMTILLFQFSDPQVRSAVIGKDRIDTPESYRAQLCLPMGENP